MESTKSTDNATISPPNVTSNDQANLVVEHGTREVTIMMMPVKDIGRVKRFLINSISWLLGSTITLGWCMHWVMRVGDSCFELKRYSEVPYTRLQATAWDGSRKDDVLLRMHVGQTKWSDKQIEELSTEYFDRTVNMPYDLYFNNCQTFITEAAGKICVESIPRDRPLGVPLMHVISFTVARFYAKLAIPLSKVYLRLMNCNPVILREYELAAQSWGYGMLPVMLYQPVMTLHALHDEIEKMLTNPEIGSPTIRYSTAIIFSVWMLGSAFSVPMAMIWITQPWPRKLHGDGIWRLSNRPQRAFTTELNGKSATHEFGLEEEIGCPSESPHSGVDSTKPNAEPEMGKLPEWSWIALVILGIVLAMVYWTWFVLKLLFAALISTARSRWKYKGK